MAILTGEILAGVLAIILFVGLILFLGSLNASGWLFLGGIIVGMGIFNGLRQ